MDRIVVAARSALVALVALATTLTWVVAAPPAHAASVSAGLPAPEAPPAIVINEIAASSSRSVADSFFELKNISGTAVDLSGWGVYRCSVTGLRAKRGYTETELSGVVLEPGEVYTAGRVGVVLASGIGPDAVFSSPFAPTGFGLYLEDADGRLVDAVAVYPSAPTPMTTECSAHGAHRRDLHLADPMNDSQPNAGQRLSRVCRPRPHSSARSAQVVWRASPGKYVAHS